ncbi:PLP-dependent aminotransferase family protein [Thalassospiraceae bacterium LMO-JJ14]|nr:PLP-dependent aminotransferase family protein [Thalassospiraceae bacterium LMO-JJ14]
MPQISDHAPLLMIAVDRDSAVPMHRQVYDQIRDAILGGRLAPGRRLPSTRALAVELSVSRNTVLAAFDQLFAEGYTEGHVGSGTRVSRVLPEDVLAARTLSEKRSVTETAPDTELSVKGQALLAAKPRMHRSSSAHTFRTGLPEIDRFPWTQWSRMVAKFWRNPPRMLVSYGDPGGHMPLRVAIAEYLRAVRGLVCDAEQVIVTAGAQQAIDLASRALLDPGDKVWIEDPGYAGIKGVLTATEAELVPLPVDEQGLVVAEGIARAPDARMAVVTPSHQYPLGAVMSLARRLELLEWAAESGAWVLEDDYDSEYRYAGRPLSALQGLDHSGRVIYVGTFSKVMFPAIRLGYMVVPPSLAEPIIRIRRSLDDQTAIVMQPVLAQFIESGHFAAHIRRMRILYAERQQVLIDTVRKHLSDVLEIAPDEAGMHMVALIRPEAGISDADVADAAARAGVSVDPLSAFYLGTPDRNGLVLGYAGSETRDIKRSVEKLAAVIGNIL